MIYGDMIAEASIKEITINENYNFSTIIESMNVLVEANILTEGEVLSKIKDVIVTKLKHLWQFILDLLAKIKHFINVTFKNSIIKSYDKMKSKYNDIKSKASSNPDIHNSLVKKIDPELYAICINDRETYIRGLTKEEEEKYSAKNAFYTIYEIYKKIPKKVEITLTKGFFDDFFNQKTYNVKVDPRDFKILYDNFYNELKKVFGSNEKNSTYSITIKKYDAGIGNTQDEYQVSAEEEIEILTNRLNSTIDTMNGLDEPYNTILKDKATYNKYLNNVITNNWKLSSNKEMNEFYKAAADGIFEDFNLYKSMITLYSKVYFGYIKECYHNLNKFHSIINKLSTAKNTL